MEARDWEECPRAITPSVALVEESRPSPCARSCHRQYQRAPDLPVGLASTERRGISRACSAVSRGTADLDDIGPNRPYPVSGNPGGLMDPRIEAVARAICIGDDLDPDAMIGVPDYTHGTRSGDHNEIPQWQAKVQEASRFVLMQDALTASAPISAALSPASTRIDVDTI